VIIKGVWRQCHSLADLGTVVESKPVSKESDRIHCGRNEGIIGNPLRLQTE